MRNRNCHNAEIKHYFGSEIQRGFIVLIRSAFVFIIISTYRPKLPGRNSNKVSLRYNSFKLTNIVNPSHNLNKRILRFFLNQKMMQITFLIDLNYNQLTSIVYNNEYYLVMMLNLDKKKNIIFYNQDILIVPFRLKSKRSKLVRLEIDGGKESSSLSDKIN